MLKIQICVETSDMKSNRHQSKKIEQNQVTVMLTFSVGLHSRCRVDSISKQTVSGHFQTDHTGTDRTYETQAKYSHSKKQTNKLSLHARSRRHCLTITMVKIFFSSTTVMWVNSNCAQYALNSDNAKYRPTHAGPFLLHVKSLNKNINSAAMSWYRPNTVSEASCNSHHTQFSDRSR